MNFTKMQGCGNDFILISLQSAQEADAYQTQASAWCDRRYGIGADGVITIQRNCLSGVDCSIRIFNADGSEAEMCGNGIRCVHNYMRSIGALQKEKLLIHTASGIRVTETVFANLVRVDMGKPILEPEKIPCTQKGGRAIMQKLSVGADHVHITAVSMGNPHAVVYADELSDELVGGVGPKISEHPFFPKKTNVEFVSVLSNTEIRMRVYERGCGETLACGTGTCAAVVAGILNNKHGHEVTAHLLGGDLVIGWNGDENQSVFMTGPAVTVFSGTIPEEV